MVGGELFLSPLNQRRRLSVLNDLFTLLYSEGIPDDQVAVHFWAWWADLHVRMLPGRKEVRGQDLVTRQPSAAATGTVMAQKPWLLSASLWGGWNWQQLLERLRNRLEDAFARLPKFDALDLPPAPSLLGVWRAPDGRAYFIRSPVFKPQLTEEEFGELALEVVLRELEGVAIEAVGCCKVCRHLFIRARLRERQYCSNRCRNEASIKRTRRARGRKPTSEGDGRRASKGKARGSQQSVVLAQPLAPTRGR